MKQNLTFAVILLAMLFMINAIPLHKRKTEFLKCSDLFPAPLDVTAMTPDPIQAGKPVTFTISGNFTEHPITSDYHQDITFSQGFPYAAEFSQDICSDSSSRNIPKCPVTDYNKKMIIQAPADLPDNYTITVYVWNENDGSDWLGCTQASVG
ncbi:hypothetical protein C1645_857215 [Glomus cerebriforme]|uniref:Phosphatidylglycerol/phosphatidylinositol transfer protein n=1 Tax=Glomus cerebriforme TaxID=658196 RepID=A0A397TPD0_9GLOM|nr:hypothetical protein C1645_857215 [Glomus cerebriforme]